MFKLLAAIFIKNRNDLKNPKVRESYGILSGIVGICFNFLLFATKLLAGFFSKSVSVVADAFNNLSDAAASVVTIVGFRLSGKNPDDDHPFGHGRMEYISGLIVSFLILIVGFELLKSSIQAIFNPVELDSSKFTIVTLCVSIAIKFYMFLYNKKIAKKIDSATMDATAKDSLNDCVSTFAVLLVILIVKFFPQIKFPLDGIAGILVALFIIKGGIDSVKETVDPLLGKKADSEFVSEIEKVVMAHSMVHGIHDLVVHDYGPGRTMVSLHVEVPGNLDIFSIHDEIDCIEVELSKKFNCNATIHMDPVDLNNEKIAEIKDYLLQVAKEIHPELSVHDVRMVPGKTHTNIIFDAVKPHGCKLTPLELQKVLSKKIKEYDKNYNAVIHVDMPFC